MLFPKHFINLHLLFEFAAKPSGETAKETAKTTVNRAALSGPFVLTAPFQTDSINKDGKKFSFDNVLDKLHPNQKSLFQAKDAKSVLHGGALPFTEGKTTVSFLHFTLECPDYFKGKLQIAKLKNYKIFVDGHKASETLNLEPKRHDIIIACLSLDGHKDTFDVSVSTTEGTITVNPQGKRPYTLNDITDGEHYTGVSVSPSGRYAIIRYSMTYPSGKVDRRDQLVEVTSGKVVLPDIQGMGYQWKADQDILFYVRQTDRTKKLCQITLPDFKETVLAEDIPNSDGFQLSPDLSYFIYTTNDEKAPRNKDFKHFNMPDDRLYDSRTHYFLHLYDMKTGLTRQINFGKTSVSCADISEDGRYLLLTSNKMELNRFPFDRTTVCRYDVKEGTIDTLLADTVGISRCQFSPDGGTLLITATAEAFNGLGKTVAKDVITNVYDLQLFLYNIATHETRALTREFNPSVNTAMWSSYDNMIYLTADNGSKTNFYRIVPKTGKITRYPYPIDLIQGYSISNRNNVIALYGQGATYARRMIWARLNNLKDTGHKLGSIDFEKNMSDVAIPACTPWNFKSSRGDTIHGFYYLPPGFNPARKYPMITYYYGGCTPTQERLEMNYPFAVWASHGYVVYIVEPSGAMGFSQEFGSRHVNTWGKMSSDDILEGTKQFCKEHNWVNDKRVACIGASYGGFMTEYLMTRTDFFRTAIAHAGISDITGYWGAGNWGYTYSEVASAKSFPWNNKEMFVEQSPIYHADKIHTPMLLIQGSLDDNVPNNQAWELYMALKILNRPVEYIQVQGENHVIRDYLKQKEWQRTIIAWFDRWLKDEPTWWNELYPNK
jgi:dipeptidyl aminopeptidase/acylaminoacyl peptidase